MYIIPKINKIKVFQNGLTKITRKIEIKENGVTFEIPLTNVNTKFKIKDNVGEAKHLISNYPPTANQPKCGSYIDVYTSGVNGKVISGKLETINFDENGSLVSMEIFDAVGNITFFTKDSISYYTINSSSSSSLIPVSASSFISSPSSTSGLSSTSNEFEFTKISSPTMNETTTSSSTPPIPENPKSNFMKTPHNSNSSYITSYGFNKRIITISYFTETKEKYQLFHEAATDFDKIFIKRQGQSRSTRYTTVHQYDFISYIVWKNSTGVNLDDINIKFVKHDKHNVEQVVYHWKSTTMKVNQISKILIGKHNAKGKKINIFGSDSYYRGLILYNDSDRFIFQGPVHYVFDRGDVSTVQPSPSEISILYDCKPKNYCLIQGRKNTNTSSSLYYQVSNSYDYYVVSLILQRGKYIMCRFKKEITKTYYIVDTAKDQSFQRPLVIKHGEESGKSKNINDSQLGVGFHKITLEPGHSSLTFTLVSKATESIKAPIHCFPNEILNKFKISDLYLVPIEEQKLLVEKYLNKFITLGNRSDDIFGQEVIYKNIEKTDSQENESEMKEHTVLHQSPTKLTNPTNSGLKTIAQLQSIKQQLYSSTTSTTPLTNKSLTPAKNVSFQQNQQTYSPPPQNITIQDSKIPHHQNHQQQATNEPLTTSSTVATRTTSPPPTLKTSNPSLYQMIQTPVLSLNPNLNSQQSSLTSSLKSVIKPSSPPLEQVIGTNTNNVVNSVKTTTGFGLPTSLSGTFGSASTLDHSFFDISNGFLSSCSQSTNTTTPSASNVVGSGSSSATSILGSSSLLSKSGSFVNLKKSLNHGGGGIDIAALNLCGLNNIRTSTNNTTALNNNSNNNVLFTPIMGGLPILSDDLQQQQLELHQKLYPNSTFYTDIVNVASNTALIPTPNKIISSPISTTITTTSKKDKKTNKDKKK